MELQAGVVSSAQLPCALLLLLPTAYIPFQPMAFTFFQRLDGSNKSYNRLDFTLQGVPEYPSSCFPCSQLFCGPIAKHALPSLPALRP